MLRRNPTKIELKLEDLQELTTKLKGEAEAKRTGDKVEVEAHKTRKEMVPAPSRSSLPYQIVLYLNGWYTAAFILAETFLLLFKMSILPYPPGNIVAEVFLLAFLGVIEWKGMTRPQAIILLTQHEVSQSQRREDIALRVNIVMRSPQRKPAAQADNEQKKSTGSTLAMSPSVAPLVVTEGRHNPIPKNRHAGPLPDPPSPTATYET
ncbi:Transmembrane protein 216 [Chionoecetes opilio]|uniref:Transmembrane protein 216 n=1 Tax=Chionoecetes opilio TaxID=41210 RepID=A0A8J5D2Q6_CHIOP|nr:Transmembrane protein 216 [Chionoecetes opilio]